MPDMIPVVLFRIGTTEMESVDGRILHTNLGMERQYGNWIKTWIRKANLINHRDYEVFTTDVKNPSGGRPTLEYALTVEAAKCIAMMSGGKRGDEVRAYFLAREQQAIALERQMQIPQVKNPANQLLIDTVVRLDNVEQRALAAEASAVQANANAARALETQLFFTVAEYVYIHKLTHQLPESAYRACSDMLRVYCLDHNIPFRKQPIGGKRWNDEYAYHISVYAEVLPGWLKRRYAQPPLHVIHTS